ncbi:hypothetical protein [Streptomyces sp. ISL-94]|nr:hypothetical protein [Streptomyces sp. ISL-94]
MLVGGLSGIIRAGSGDWRRFLDLAFEGLGPRGDGPASAAPTAHP